MPFDPVRDAVLNSPQTRSYPLPLTSSPPESYLLNSHAVSSTAPANAVSSPSSSRRATDLSVLLNSEDRVPSPTFQRRPSTSTSTSTSLIIGSPSLGTPRSRSTHLSHILQHQPIPNDAAQSVTPAASSASPLTSPLSRNTEILPPSLSRSHAPPRPPSDVPMDVPMDVTQPDILRRASSSSASGSKSQSRSPEMPRATTLNNGPPVSASVSSPLMGSSHRVNNRPAIPYAPRNRRTAPGSILIPFSEQEREFYRKLSKNPLKANAPGKRVYEDVSHDSLLSRGADEPPHKITRDVGLVVRHYNHRPDVGVTQRQQSPIIGLKNFNNWVKSVLIVRFAHPAFHAVENNDVKVGHAGKVQFNGGGGRVLDLGCGKGGDLNKWQKAKVQDYVGIDIAEVSVDQARLRYMSSAAANPMKSSSRFTAFFAALDCFSQSLSETPNIPLPPRAPPFDVVSMQFCMHYAFESVQKARVMLENVTRWLRKGGRFVGTIPNDKFLLDRLDALPPNQDHSDLSFGNSVYRIKFDDRERRPVFGHRYTFFLRDAVEDVPEYIVHWDNFKQMASEYQLELLYKAEFHDVYAEHCDHPEFRPLLERMKVVDSNGESHMDEDQWEAANVYVAFAFEKK